MNLITVLTQSRQPGTSDINWRTIDPELAEGFRMRLEDVRELVDKSEAEKKIKALNTLIIKAQALLNDYSVPNGKPERDTLLELIELFDGPEQRAAQPNDTPMQDKERELVMTGEDPAEAAYWVFDARVKGYGEWKNRPQSERDAFKALFRIAMLSEPPSWDALALQKGMDATPMYLVHGSKDAIACAKRMMDIVDAGVLLNADVKTLLAYCDGPLPTKGLIRNTPGSLRAIEQVFKQSAILSGLNNVCVA